MRFAAALLCFAMLQAIPPPRDGATPGPKAGTGIITGRVLAGTTDIGVAGAMVYLVLDGPTSTLFPRAVFTDRSGRFTIDTLAAGSYRLDAMPPDHTARFLSPGRPSRPVDVAEGTTAAAPEIRLPVGAAVSGRVTDEHGEPLASVRVYAMGQGGGPKLEHVSSFQVHTDDHGRFRVFGLRAGDVVLAAEAYKSMGRTDGLDRMPAFVTTYHPDVVSAAEAQRITIREGVDVEGIDIRMTRVRTFRVTGTIVDSRGVPYAARAGLHHRASDGSGGTISIDVNQDGTFAAAGLVPGRYRILVGALGFGPGGPSPATEYASVPVDISDADVADLLVTTRPAADVTVRVVFEPQPPAPLPSNFGVIGWSARELGFSPPQAELDKDSTVVLKGAFGPLLLRPMSAAGQPEWFLKGVFLGARDITDTPTEFAPADAARVRIVFSKTAATITGTLTNDAGKAALDGAVVLFPEDRAAWIDYSSGILTAMADKAGAYKIPGVRAGRYRIAATDRAGLMRVYQDRLGLLESLLGDSVAIAVTENEQRVVDLRRAGGA